MTEPTSPPPERPLPDAARVRIRAELLQHAHDNRSSTPRWLVPAGAAVAVALVAGMAYWAVGPGDRDATVGPAGGATTFVPETGRPSTGPSDSASLTPSVAPSAPGSSVPAGGEPTGTQVGTGSCAVELDNVLRGASLAVQVDDASSFWVKGDRFVLCDQLGGRTTVHHPLPLTPELKESTYAVSTVFDGRQTVRAAGGVVPAGAEDFTIDFTFPDGHVEHGTTATDGQGRTWWHMGYAYDDGGGNELKEPEIQVDVGYGGFDYVFKLQWGVDTCAQANHGC